MNDVRFMNVIESRNTMETEQPEKAWLAAYRKGDVSAMSCLVEYYRKPLFAYIYNMLQGRGDAEEIFQDVWLRAIRNLHQYREKNFGGWLFRIARNLFIDQVRRERHMAVPVSEGSREDESSPIERFPSRDLTPDRQAEARDLGHRIQQALAMLPDDQREVFLLRTEADIPFKVIAEIQGISLNTALARMHYAVQKLRPLLEEDYKQLAGGI